MLVLALLVGLFLVPVWLLWLGHHLRSRSARGRGAFWGGSVGYGAGMLASLAAFHLPPVHWDATGSGRAALAFLGMCVFTLAGAAAGWLRAGRRVSSLG